jgi:predicted transcriptional regulator
MEVFGWMWSLPPVGFPLASARRRQRPMMRVANLIGFFGQIVTMPPCVSRVAKPPKFEAPSLPRFRVLSLRQTLPRAGFCRTLSLMEIHFTLEQEAKLAQSAAQQGRNPDELVRQVVARYFDEESRFVDAVRRGEEALQRGDYLTHEQVGQRLERFLQP